MPTLSGRSRVRTNAAVERLFDGVRKFNTEVFPNQRDRFEQLAEKQAPGTLFITCADSRVMPEMITQSEPGDLFVCRNVGNIVPPYGAALGGVSSVIEYAVSALKVQNIVVCGHTNCGAMAGLVGIQDGAVDAMPTVKNWLRNAEAARAIVEATKGELSGPEKIQALVEQNVLTQLQQLETHPSVAAAMATDQISLHGWVYDIRNGEVRTYDDEVDEFVPLGKQAES